MIARIETINPQKATEYLALNIERNRRVRQTLVDALARDMRSGAFVATHQGIAFDTSGKLIDGQHRLHAIIKSGKTVNMMVTRDVPASAIGKIDNGATRSIGDAMKIKYSDNSPLSIAMRNKRCLGAISRLMYICANKKRATIKEFESFYSAYPEVCIGYSGAAYHTHNATNYNIGAACLAAMLNGVPVDAVRKFIRLYGNADISGCGEYNVQVVLTFRHYLDGLRARHMRMNDSQMFLAAQRVLYTFVNNNSGGRIEFDKVNEITYQSKDFLKNIIF